MPTVKDIIKQYLEQGNFTEASNHLNEFKSELGTDQYNALIKNMKNSMNSYNEQYYYQKQKRREIVKDRKIEYLVHFTNLENLSSILRYGLLPRSILNESNISYNDYDRIDGKDHINLSISFPNYKMFYSLRKNNPEKKWVVLLIDPSILYEDDIRKVKFSNTNAASNNASIGYAETYFIKMFDGVRNSNIPLSYTTNPQAEILVYKKIDVDKIKKVIFQSNKNIPENLNKNVIYEIDNDYFSSREYVLDGNWSDNRNYYNDNWNNNWNDNWNKKLNRNDNNWNNNSSDDWDDDYSF